MKHEKLCDVADLVLSGSKSVTVEGDQNGGQHSIDLVLVQNELGIFCYVDHCPHTGSPLAWRLDQFLDVGKEYIVCSTHGALFTIDSGLCVSGPCVDQSLQRVPIKVVEGEIFLPDRHWLKRD